MEFSKVLYKDLKQHFQDFYDGKVKHPCDENCPGTCDGKHNFEIPKKINNIFEEEAGK
jgi:hypothetical protein